MIAMHACRILPMIFARVVQFSFLASALTYLMTSLETLTFLLMTPILMKTSDPGDFWGVVILLIFVVIFVNSVGDTFCAKVNISLIFSSHCQPLKTSMPFMMNSRWDKNNKTYFRYFLPKLVSCGRLRILYHQTIWILAFLQYTLLMRIIWFNKLKFIVATNMQ